MTVSNGWHFLTFGGGTLGNRGAVKRLSLEARRTGWFSTIDGLNDRDLRSTYPEFFSRHENLLVPGSRGFGYWVWKPFLVLEALRHAGARTTGLVYCDSGNALNLTEQSTLRMQQYFELAVSGGGLCMQMSEHPESSWTKNELLDHLGVTREHRLQGQITSCAFLLVSNEESIAFAERWLALATADGYRFLNDARSSEDEANTMFREHRHDQSIFSCLAKTMQLPSIADETYWAPDWRRNGANYPIWALRSRSRTRHIDRRPGPRLLRFAERVHERVSRGPDDAADSGWGANREHE